MRTFSAWDNLAMAGMASPWHGEPTVWLRLHFILAYSPEFMGRGESVTFTLGYAA